MLKKIFIYVVTPQKLYQKLAEQVRPSSLSCRTRFYTLLKGFSHYRTLELIPILNFNLNKANSDFTIYKFELYSQNLKDCSFEHSN